MNLLLTSLRSLLLIAAFAFVVVACKKDSDPEPTSAEIKGTWTIKSVASDPEDSAAGEYITDLNNGTCKSQINIAFNDGGSISVTAPNTCLADLTLINLFINSTTKWEVKNNKLLLTQDGDTIEFDMTTSGSDVTLIGQIDFGFENFKLTLVLTRK